MALSSGQNMVNMSSGNNTGLGLNRATDEFKYLATKQKVDLMNRNPYGTQLGDPKTELDKAWANFKAVNDELKAKGYTYIEAKDGAYGTVLKFDEKTTPKSDSPYKPTINGPNGTIDELGAYKPGTMEFADPRMDVNSPKYDKDLAELYKKARGSLTYMGGRLGLASNTLLASEELKTIADRLIAKGVDVVKLEKDNPNFQLSSVAMSPSQHEDYNAWANSPAGRTTLERASEIANQQNNNLLSGANNNTGPNSPSAVSSPSTVAENEAALKTAWADFKSVNDELKAKGYSYQEAKDGMYGTAVGLTVPNNDIFNNVEGPKGLVRDAARVDESLNDLYFRARAGVKNLWPASASLAQAQSFQEIQDNPAGILAGTNNQVATFGAVPITGQATLGQAPGLAGNPTTGPVYTPGTTGAGNNTGLNPASDEFKYLQAKQESQHVGFSSPKIEDTTAGLAGAWAQFKADNEKLKAEGYDYQEVKPGFYGKPVVSTDSFLTRVSGPKGDIVGVTGSLSSELKDIRVRAKGPASLYDASQQYSADQKVDELSKALIAKGVDIAKLEQNDSIKTEVGARSYLTIKSMDDRSPETRLKDAWSDYKASNEKLKAAGYSYDPILDDSKMEIGALVKGPNGMIWDKPGFSLQLDEASQDKSHPDFKLSYDHFSAQSNLASTRSSLKKYNELSSLLSESGIDLAKLEKDNPNFFKNTLSNTTGKDIFNNSSLGSLAYSENEGILGASAAKNILGAPDRQRGGGAGGNLMQANATNPGVPATGIYIEQFINPIQAQTNAMNAGTWKPSDGYYFSSPNGIGFDPTGKVKDIIDSHPLMSGNNSPEPDNQKALKDAGYSYMTGLGNDTMVVGPKGPYNVGWTSDPAKKGDYQKDLEKIWESSGVSFSQQTPQSASLASAPTAVSLSADTPQLPAVPNAFIATGVQPPQQPASGTGFDPSTISIVTNANSGAVLPQNQTVKPILIPDKNGNLVPASTTKGGSIGAPGSTASPYAQTTVPSFATKDTYTQKSPRQYP